MVGVHFEVHTINCLETVFENLFEVLNFKDFIFSLFLCNLSRDILIAVLVEVLGFKTIVFVSLVLSANLVRGTSLLTAAHQEEARVLTLTVCLRQSLLKVNSEEQIDQTASYKENQGVECAKVQLFSCDVGDSIVHEVAGQRGGSVRQRQSREEKTHQDFLPVHGGLRDEKRLYQRRAEVNSRRGARCQLRVRENRLGDQKQSKKRLAVQPQEAPDNATISPLEDIETQNYPAGQRNCRVDTSPIYEPREPICKVTHAHHAHRFFRTSELLTHHTVNRSVQEWDEHQLHEEGEDPSEDLREDVNL